MDNYDKTSTGITFTGLLTILFVALKLLGVISWSWIWVLSPLWIGFALVLILFIVFYLVGVIIGIRIKNKEKDKWLKK